MNALMHSDAESGNDVWSSFEQTTKGCTKHTTESRVARIWSQFGVAAQVETRPPPHKGVRLATFWMLQDRYARLHSALGPVTQRPTFGPNHTRHSHYLISNVRGSDTTSARSHNLLPQFLVGDYSHQVQRFKPSFLQVSDVLFAGKFFVEDQT